MQQQQFQATVPMGLNPGDQFQIMTPSGPVTLSVPLGHPPGSSFMFSMPAMAQPMGLPTAQPMGLPTAPMAQQMGPVMGQPVMMGTPYGQQPYGQQPYGQQPYGQQPYGAPPPQIIMQAPAPIVVNQQPGVSVSVPPPGAPPGGVYQEETFIGTTTFIMCLFLLIFFWPATCVPFCCPCDQRVVYIHGGIKYTRSGEIVPMGGECCGYPCGGPQ